MKISKRIVSAILSAVLISTPISRAFALSQGAEVGSVISGSAMVLIGKKKNKPVLKYVGWGLIATGGTVIVADGVFYVFTMAFVAGFMGALMGEMLLLPFKILTLPLQSQNSKDQVEAIPVASILAELENEIHLATTLSNTEGVQQLALAELAQAINVPADQFARSMANAMNAADQINASVKFGPSVQTLPRHAVERMVEVQGNSAQRETVTNIMINYMRLRNVAVGA